MNWSIHFYEAHVPCNVLCMGEEMNVTMLQCINKYNLVVVSFIFANFWMPSLRN